VDIRRIRREEMGFIFQAHNLIHFLTHDVRMIEGFNSVYNLKDGKLNNHSH
jgi:ABC-type lipoprotein export system ATPase subunit